MQGAEGAAKEAAGGGSAKAASTATGVGGKDAAAVGGGKGDPTKASNFHKALKIVERMVVLNQHSDVAIDFKYYENEADDIHLDGLLIFFFRFPLMVPQCVLQKIRG